MWKRNLLFLAVSAAGIAGPILWLAPRSAARSTATSPETGSSKTGSTKLGADADFAKTVAAVDAAFERAWSDRRLTPAAPADDLTLARRLSLALDGTVPSLEEIRALESEPAPGRVDRRLAAAWLDRRTSDYLAQRWARALVGVEDGPFLLFRRRKFVAWLSDRFAENRPYDETVRHLIADEGLWTDSPAVNYLTVTVKPMEGPDPDPNVLAARTARAMLGVRIDCAECHDHPFDKWKQSDFEGLAAFFAEAKQKNLQGLRDRPQPYVVEDAKTGTKRTVAPCVPFEPQLFAKTGRSREALARWITHRENKAFARSSANRAWAVLFGRPLIEPIDDVRWDEGDAALELERKVLDLLADDFATHGYDLRRLLSLVAAARPFRLESRIDGDVTDEQEQAWAVFPLVRLRPEQVIGAILQATSVTTLDPEQDVTMRAIQFLTEQDFVKRYGDAGDEEFAPHAGTIPQRLLMMNGRLVRDKLRDPLIFNAATRIGMLADGPKGAVEAAYLAVLTRRPTPEELTYFSDRFDAPPRRTRPQAVEDLYWTLFNSTEFAWNH
jgi:hypothetical protein